MDKGKIDEVIQCFAGLPRDESQNVVAPDSSLFVGLRATDLVMPSSYGLAVA